MEKNRETSQKTASKKSSKALVSFGKGQKDTKYKLIIAGINLFGEYGYKGTSTRMLTNYAKVNLASIPYYFGSKEQLYKAVIEYIVDRIVDNTGSVRDELKYILNQPQPDLLKAKQLFKSIIEKIVAMFVETDDTKSWLQIMLREQSNPSPAFEIVYSRQIKPMQELITTMIGLCTQINPESDEAKVRCQAFIGQILGFFVARSSFMRQMGTKKLNESQIEIIHKVILAHTEACLNIKQLI
ncbi:MAG: CerR family C-terminal domain-containing protein [Alphaproteobacteria bacterium]